MEKWFDIAFTLSECKRQNYSEEDYQSKIEDQFKFLGWSIYLGCVESKPSLPVGNSKVIIPDIVLKKDGERVLPIEIKEPNNHLKKRQEEQLFSYMKQLDLRVGLYIGEILQLYYNAPDDKEEPHIILTTNFDADSKSGNVFCDLLSYDTFSVEKLECYCAKQLQRIRFRKKVCKQFDELNNEVNGHQFISNLICEHFSKNELYFADILEEELEKLDVHFAYGKGKSIPAPKKEEKKSVLRGKRVMYSLNGGPALTKARFALEAVRLYVNKHPNASYSEIVEVFPKSLQGSYGVVRRMSEIEDYVEAGSNVMGRYSSTPQEILVSSDGVRFVVCNQWDYHNLPNLIEVLKNLKWKVKEIK